jgi:hypothetical protein
MNGSGIELDDFVMRRKRDATSIGVKERRHVQKRCRRCTLPAHYKGSGERCSGFFADEFHDAPNDQAKAQQTEYHRSAKASYD